MQRFVVGVATILVSVATAAQADQVQRSISDVAYINNGRGESRILFRLADLSDLGNFVIKRARLEIPISGSANGRSLPLRLHNLTTEWVPNGVDWSTGWIRPGGDFDESVYAAAPLDLSRGAHTWRADVSQLLKEVYESGGESEGILLTLASDEVEGIASEDLSRFSGLASATLYVDYVTVPLPPSSMLGQ